jgi:hypothetical protein
MLSNIFNQICQQMKCFTSKRPTQPEGVSPNLPSQERPGAATDDKMPPSKSIPRSDTGRSDCSSTLEPQDSVDKRRRERMEKRERRRKKAESYPEVQYLENFYIVEEKLKAMAKELFIDPKTYQMTVGVDVFALPMAIT